MTLKVFDVLGNELKTIINEEQDEGNYNLDFEALNFASGIYFYSLKTENFVSTKKMILLK